MAEVWYTHCLKEYLFPEFQGEKFLGEDIVWVRMSEKYKMRFFNRVIYISDYLEDGLTNNRASIFRLCWIDRINYAIIKRLMEIFSKTNSLGMITGECVIWI